MWKFLTLIKKDAPFYQYYGSGETFNLYIAKRNTLENVTKQSIPLQRKLSMIFTNKVG